MRRKEEGSRGFTRLSFSVRLLCLCSWGWGVGGVAYLVSGEKSLQIRQPADVTQPLLVRCEAERLTMAPLLLSPPTPAPSSSPSDSVYTWFRQRRRQHHHCHGWDPPAASGLLEMTNTI